MTGAERVAVPMGRTFKTEVGTFVRYQVDRWVAIGRANFRDGVVAAGAKLAATRVAERAGLRVVVDTVSAVEQPDGDWIVELQVRP